MEEDIQFAKLKECVEHSRKKIRQCMVKKNHADERISWNSIWNELQKNDWQVSKEMKQRLQFWYGLTGPFSTPRPKIREKFNVNVAEDEDRELSHTLPSFMIDGWPEEMEKQDVAARTTSSVLYAPQADFFGKTIQQQDVVQNQLSLEVSAWSLGGVAAPISVAAVPAGGCHAENWLVTREESFSNHPSSWSPARLARINEFVPKMTPAAATRSAMLQTIVIPNRRLGLQHEIQSKSTVKIEPWCLPLASTSFSMLPHETNSQQNTENWRREQVDTKSFRSYQIKPGVPRRSSPDYQSSSRQIVDSQLLAETVNTDQQYTPPSLKKNTLWREKRVILKTEYKKKNVPSSSLKSNRKTKDFTLTFPPGNYVRKRGDWIVHAIVSICAQPDDLRLALEKRGYELKYITKRKCTLPNKWVCSLIANADRTHILTSENIWVNSWEVDFVCSEEDIAPFLVK